MNTKQLMISFALITMTASIFSNPVVVEAATVAVTPTVMEAWKAAARTTFNAAKHNVVNATKFVGTKANVARVAVVGAAVPVLTSATFVTTAVAGTVWAAAELHDNNYNLEDTAESMKSNATKFGNGVKRAGTNLARNCGLTK